MKIFTKIHSLVLIVLITFIFNNATVRANFFSVGEIDPSNFPTVKTTFLALNQGMMAYNNLSAADFIIIENNQVIPEHRVQVICDDVPMSIVLVFDVSTSMKEVVNGKQLMQIVKEGGINFLNDINFDNGTRVAITSFAGRNYLNTPRWSPFLDDRDELKKILGDIEVVNGTTNFNVAFFNDGPTAYGGAIDLLNDEPPTHRKVIVFLTDGRHETMSAPLKKQEIIDALYEKNIQLHAITFMDLEGVNGNLSDMAKESGGRYYIENNPNELNKIYEAITADMNKKPVCLLIWEADPACDLVSSFREVKINFTRQPQAIVTKHYKAPPDNYVVIEKDKIIYTFDNPDIGSTSEEEVKITPRQHDILVNYVEIVPKGFFEVDWGKGFGANFTPNDAFVIAENEEFTFNVRFTPKIKKVLRQATLIINGEPCPLEIPLIGGQTKIKIVAPNEGDVFSACETIEIKWEGIDTDIRVNLDYSSNDGQRWTRIASNITGGSYTWNPPLQDATYRFRVSVAFASEYKWAISLGNENNDFVTSIDVQSNGLYNYISGYFTDNLNTGNNTLSSKGGNDAFIAKFDSDGNPIWSVSAGGPGDDRANGLALDPAGNVYVTGYCFTGAQFGFYTPGMLSSENSYLFIAKYLNNGQYADVKVIGTTNQNPKIEFRANNIRYHYTPDMDFPLIYVRGLYRGKFEIYEQKIQLDETNNQWRSFVAVFDTYLNLVNMYMGNDNTPGYSSLNKSDLNGDVYRTNTFSDERSYSFTTLKSNGGTDIYIDRFGPIQSSADISESVRVILPKLEFSISELDLGDILLGDTLDVLTELILTNVTEIPIEIKDIYFDEILGNDFWILETIEDPENPENIIPELIGEVLNYGDTISIIFNHAPTDFKYRTAMLVVVPDCGFNAVLPIKSYGMCEAIVQTPIVFEPTYLGKENIIIQEAIVCNPTNVLIKIKPYIYSNGNPVDDVHWHYFELVGIASEQIIEIPPDTCISITIKFKPTKAGVKTAYINYRSNIECDVPETVLIGEGITAIVAVNSIDWQEQRVNGSYPDKLIITNPSNVPETILDIQFSNPQHASSFDIVGLSQPPFQIPADASLEFDINFEPNAEQNYNTNIILTVTNQENPAVGNFNGTGILPRMNVDWLCSSPILPDKPSEVYLTISNPSQSADLQINSIDLSNIDEFEWENGIQPTNITIPKGGDETFTILLTAQESSNHTTDVIILADDFDGSFTEEWKTTTQLRGCDILTFTLNDLNFNNVVICDEHTLSVNISNSSTSTPMTIYASQSEIIGVDAAWFTLNLTNDIIIQPGGNIELDVSFVPTELRTYNAELLISNSANIPMLANLSGTGVAYELIANRNSYSLTPGKNNKQQLAIAANLPVLDKGFVTDLEIHIKYNSFAMNFDLNSFSSILNIGNNENWNWNTPRYEVGGNLYISGSGQLRTPFNERGLFTLNLYAYLSEFEETALSFTVDYQCTNIEHLTIPVTIERICAYELRQVSISSFEFELGTPTPNPSASSFNLEYSIGYDIPTTLKIYDVMGNLVETLLEANLQGGKYILTVTTENLPSGIYYIRMESGHFIETRQLNIVK